MAVTLVSARFGAIMGNLVFALFLDVQCAVPILMVAALLVGKLSIRFIEICIYLSFIIAGGGLLGLLLPNTTNTPLQ